MKDGHLFFSIVGAFEAFRGIGDKGIVTEK